MNFDNNFYRMKTEYFSKYLVITYTFNNGTVIIENILADKCSISRIAQLIFLCDKYIK